MPAVLKKRKLRIVSDPFLFCGAIILQLGAWVAPVLCVWNGAWMGLLVTGIPAGTLTGVLVYAAIVGANEWANIVTVTENGVQEGPFFLRRHFHSYGELPLVYCTSYVHGMIGSPDVGPKRMFIVLTDQRLSDAEKENINLVRSSRKLVKIKYSKKRYAMLMEILPQNLKAQLAAAFLVQIEPDNLARRRSAITSKARRRKKQKHHK